MKKFFLILFLLSSVSAFSENKENEHLRFDFGTGAVEQGYVQVVPSMKYSQQRGFGFLTDSVIYSVTRNSDDALKCDFCTAKDPFIFAVDTPEGNYDVFVTLGDYESKSVTTIKAESRRLMLEKIRTEPGEFKKVTFTANVRYSQIDSATSVKLKPREIEHFNWDKRLTIEFNDQNPCVCGVEIVKTTKPITIFLAGNSTVTDQKLEPWASWGQILPRFFKSGDVVVANHAESGESLKSFIGENRLKKIFSAAKAGDYLFIQFGHNDQKKESASYVEPFTGYKEYLKHFINTARHRGVIPILTTPMHRRRFDENGKIVNTHGDYPAAMRETANEEHAPLIDLFKMSAALFESLGVEGSKNAFVHYPAGTFPGQSEALSDDTHFNNYGAYELAKCVVEGIRSNHLELTRYLADDAQTFDPNHPDSFDSWDLPVSPFAPAQ
ncbi:rhamnogalacturonan acetylesterase [candidate division KSB1 bacterium]|nr:rhamnogalacturonan acetylesterase [candidate division KSB1 bacterium]